MRFARARYGPISALYTYSISIVNTAHLVRDGRLTLAVVARPIIPIVAPNRQSPSTNSLFLLAMGKKSRGLLSAINN